MKGKIELKNYGFHKNIKNYQNLMNIYKTLEPLSKFVEYKEQAYGMPRIAMIVPNNYKEICLEDQKQLSKPYWTYNQNYYKWFGTQKEFDAMIAKIKKEEQRQIKKDKGISNGGVYGVYKNGELIYIGSTIDFNKRWAEHKRYMKNRDYKLHFYKLFQPGDRVDFKVLIDGSKLEADREITPMDLKTMEYALINVFKPIGNIAGRIQPFKYK